MGLQFVTASNALSLPIRINVGGNEASGYAGDHIWDYKQEYGATGGTIRQRTLGSISGATEPTIYETEREGLNFYQVRLSSGKYRVTLMMAESEHDAAGERVFDVYAEGNLAIDDLDVLAEAGKNAALEKVISDLDVTDGVLDLYFAPQADVAILSGLRIERLVSTGVESAPGAPQKFNLRVYPNPFNPSTKVEYSLEKAGQVEISLFDVTGRLVRKLAQGFQTAGSHSLVMDGERLSAGMYLVSMNAGSGARQVEKIVYIK
jgi:hypothetical protein